MTLIKAVGGDRAVRTVTAAALALVLLLAWWAAVLAAADEAWREFAYSPPQIITVATRFATGIPVIVLGVLLVARPALRRLGTILVVVGMAWFLPTITADLLAAGGMSRPGAAVSMSVSAVCFAFRAPTVLLLPLWLVPARPLSAGWARTALTVLGTGYYLGYGLLWGLSSTMAEPAIDPPVANPLAQSPLGPWAQTVAEPYTDAEELVLGCVSAAGTGALALVAAHAPAPSRRQLWILTVLYPLCSQLLLSQRWETNLTAVSALLTGSAVWAAAIGIGIAGSGAWRLDRSARHRIAQACAFIAVAAAVDLLATAAWIGLPAVHHASTILVAVGALALGAALRPIARWATLRVEDVFYGPRTGPQEAARALAHRLQQAPHPREVPDQICRSAVEDIGVAGAAVSVDTRSGPRRLADAGRPPDEAGAPTQSFPLRHHSRTVGHLTITRDGTGTPPERDSDLLALLADQAGPALAALQLTEEAQSARERLVLTREEERRRLRREIHDGLGPLLASARLRIDTAQARRQAGQSDTAELQLALDGLDEALTEVRRITAGLTPAALVERGLADAVRDLARRLTHPGLTVLVDARFGPHRLAPAVETAAYRITAEALTNAVRHATARHIHITLTSTTTEDVLTVTVADDGTGTATSTAPAGTGMASMTERAEEIGGSCTITTTAAGTTICARLPAPPHEQDDHR